MHSRNPFPSMTSAGMLWQALTDAQRNSPPAREPQMPSRRGDLPRLTRLASRVPLLRAVLRAYHTRRYIQAKRFLDDFALRAQAQAHEQLHRDQAGYAYAARSVPAGMQLAQSTQHVQQAQGLVNAVESRIDELGKLHAQVH